jgi:hypothetical protein
MIVHCGSNIKIKNKKIQLKVEVNVDIVEYYITIIPTIVATQIND